MNLISEDDIAKFHMELDAIKHHHNGQTEVKYSIVEVTFFPVQSCPRDGQHAKHGGQYAGGLSGQSSPLGQEHGPMPPWPGEAPSRKRRKDLK